MEGINKRFVSFSRQHGRASVLPMIIISFIAIFFTFGVAWGVAMAERNNRMGEEPNSSGFNIDSALTYPEGASTTTVADCLDAWINKQRSNAWHGSGNKGSAFAEAGRANNVNPGLMVAITGIESEFGTTNGDRYLYNPFGWSSPEKFPSWEEGISHVANVLSRDYLQQGKTTIETIGNTYCPVGASNDANGTNGEWIPAVTKYFSQIVTACPVLKIEEPLGSSGTGGEFAPPFGNRSNLISTRTSAHPQSGIFGTSGFPGGFDKSAGDAALDFKGAGPIYAAFDGKVTKTITNHVSQSGGGKKSGGILWLTSTDGNNGAVYGHITFASGVRENSIVKRGQKLGTVSLRCSESPGAQCTNLGPHLHFEFYINKKGLNTNEMRRLFGVK